MSITVFGIEISVKKESLIVIVLLLGLLLGLIGFLITQNDTGVVFDSEGSVKTAVEESPVETQAQETQTAAAPEKNGSEKNEPEKDEKIENEIKVYVAGRVKRPGIVTLKKGQLLDDAIAAAGGVTQEADMDRINLVYELKENLMLYIKSTEEILKNPGGAEAGTGVEVIRDSGGAVVFNEGSSAGPGSGGKVNINTAGINELDTLPGIGEATAQDIISYREKNGPFGKTADIMKVPRIKESRYNSIKDFITVD